MKKTRAFTRKTNDYIEYIALVHPQRYPSTFVKIKNLNKRPSTTQPTVQPRKNVHTDLIST